MLPLSHAIRGGQLGRAKVGRQQAVQGACALVLPRVLGHGSVMCRTGARAVRCRQVTVVSAALQCSSTGRVSSAVRAAVLLCRNAVTGEAVQAEGWHC